MKTKLIRIGNSKEVRIPKPLIEQSGLSEDIAVILKDEKIILRSAKDPRKNWELSVNQLRPKSWMCSKEWFPNNYVNLEDAWS